MREWGPAVLRVTVGTVFVAHGLQMLLPVFGGGGVRSTAADFASMGLEPAYPLALLAGVTELGGGVALILGVFTLYAAIALIITMLVATWKVHLANGFFLNWAITPGVGHGYEFNLVLIAALVSLCLTGAGAVSVDRWRLRSAEAREFGRARVRSRNV